MRSKIFTALSLLLVCAATYGQTAKSETYLIGYKITSLEKKSSGVYKVTIPYGLNAGIKNGKNVTSYGMARSDVKSHNHELGKGAWTSVTSGEATAEVTLNENEKLYVGDLVYTNCEVPLRLRTSYFFLITEAISIVNDSGEPYYTFREIFDGDGYVLRKQKFLAMQKDIQAAGEKLKLAGNKSVVQAGPNAGKLVSETMMATDTMSVWYYIYHLNQMSWDTMGQTYKLSDSFQAYTEEGDVASPALLKTLFVGMSEKTIDERFVHYKRKITKELLESWKDSAFKLKGDKKYDEAISLFETAAVLAGKIGERYNQGVYLFSIGEIHEYNGDYDKAIEAYKKTGNIFKAPEENFALGYLNHNLGSCYKELKQYTEASKYFTEAVKIRSQLVIDNPTNAYVENLYKSVELLGGTTIELGDLPKALEYYRLSLQAAQQSGNTANEADAYWNIAFVEGKMDRNTESYNNYTKAASIYLDRKDTANVLILDRSRAIILVNDKKFAAAKKVVEEGVALARDWKNNKYLAYILNYQGTMMYDHQEYDQSSKSFAEAQIYYKKENDKTKLIDAIKAHAKSLRDSKRYSEALAKHKERIPYLDPKDAYQQADLEWDLAYTYGRMKDTKNEVLHYLNAEKYYLMVGDSANISTLINNIGYAYRDGRDSVNSYKQLNRVIQFDKSRKNNAAIGYSYEHLAYSYKEFKNTARAIENFKLAQQYYDKAGDKLKSAKMVDELAQVLWMAKKFQEATSVAERSIKLYHDLNNLEEEASAYWDLAYQQGTSVAEFDKAIANYKAAYDLFILIPDSVSASTMLSNIGQDYWSKLNYEKAIEYHKAAIAIAEKSHNDKQVASSWSKLSTLYKESNNPVAAAAALNNAANALVLVKDSVMLATTYQDLGNNYRNSKDYPKALDFYNKAIVIRKALGDSTGLGVSYNDVAFFYQTRGDYKNGESYYLQSLAIRRKLLDKEGEMYTLVGLGNLEENVSTNYVKSEKYFLQAEAMAKAAKNDYLLAYIYGQMKWLYRSQGKAALAEASVKKSLDIYRKIKNAKEIANTLISMAYDVSYIKGDQVGAMKILDEAQVITDTLKDVYAQGQLMGQRGTIYREMGDFQKALEYANKSMALYKSIDNDWGMAGIHIDLGNLYKQISEYDLGVKNQMIADSLFKASNSEYARLAPLANIGENYSAQGDYVKAMTYYQQSLAIMTKAKDNNENLAIMQGLMGESNFYLGNFTEAEKWLKQSLATSDNVGALRPKADNLSVMGRLKLEEKKYEEARTFLAAGLKLAKEKSMKISYLNNLVLLGRLEVEKKNFTAAKPLLDEAIKVSREINKSNTLWESLYWNGVMFKEMKDLKQSSEFLKESVAVIEKIRNKVSGGEEARKLFSSDKNISKVSEVLVDVLLQMGETELAMSYLQKSNEDNLKAKYRGLDIKFQDEGKNKVLGQEKLMKAKLDGIEQQIANEKALPTEKQNLAKIKSLEGIQTIAESDYLKFVNQQVNVQPELSKFFSNSVQPSEFRKRKKQIPKDMALLSYLPGEKQLYIFMATSDTVIAKVVNVTREQLAKNINGIMGVVKAQQGSFGKLELAKEEQERKEIASAVKQTDRAMLPFEELYHSLISPVAEEISTKKKLCIIPNGALSYIPFQLLGKTLGNGKFSLLANQYAIFYANSTDMLLRTLEGGEKDYNILAFGNPDKSLPSTEKEVSDIKKLFPNAEIYTREQATEDRAKFAGSNFNVMHFATHGNLDYEDFSKSYLTMAGNPSKNEDGKLTLEELWGMEVMNHLNIVVLSACQTAVTKGSNESSPVSPASGFLQNGVKSVVATLWKVDDEATSLLIGEFYKNIKTMDAVDALRSAQVSVSANPKFAMPYYWAGAILLGDWR